MKFFAWVTILVALEHQSALANMMDCVEEESFDPLRDYFPNKYRPTTYAVPDFFEVQAELDTTTDLLDIEYHKYYKIVRNNFVNTSYLLYQCGTTPPESEAGKHHLTLPVPHKGGVALTQTPHITPLELLGKRQEIKAYIGDPQWISSPCLNYRIENGDLDVVHQEGSFGANVTLMENYVEENPDILIIGGLFTGLENEPRVMMAAGAQERTNVATFDWIAFYAALFNLEGEANRIISEAKEQYECTSTNAGMITADLPQEEQVTVLWANYFDGYNWSVAECPTWDHTYYCEYAAHCGANIISRPENVGTQINGFWYLNDEEFLELGRNADVWIYPSQFWESLFDNKQSVIEQVKAYQNKEVYDTQGGGPNAWYEQRLAEYHVVGQDFCDIVGVENPLDAQVYERKWLRNIFTDPVGSQGSCDVPEGLTAPHKARMNGCTLYEGKVDKETNDNGDMTDTEAGPEPSAAFFSYPGWAIMAVLAVTLSWFIR